MLTIHRFGKRYRGCALSPLRQGIACALSLMFMFMLLHTATAGELKVVHSGNWPPYSGADLPGQGLAIELVTTALERAGYSASVSIDSLERILEGSKTGSYDVFATPWYTMERDRFLHFSRPYLESSIRFIKRKHSDFAYTTFDDLDGLRIGVVKGYAYDEDFNQSPAIDKVSANSLTQNLRKLLAKEIDLTLDDERVLLYEIARSTPDAATTLEILEKPLVVRGVNIGVSRKNPDHARIVADFDKAIAAMKQDGTYEEILEKHR
jgi:polar amino acid transport system substrate-binding protein